MRKSVALFVIGAGTMVALYGATGWWLDSGRRVVTTAIVLAVVAALAAPPWLRAVALWAGVVAGMIGVLFWHGPGTIFPIVIAVGAGITALAVTAGSVLGRVVRSWREP